MIDDFYMAAPLAQLRWKGGPVPLTGSESQLVWALMKAYPNPVKIEVILDRIGSDSTYNAVQVFIHRIRKKLKAMGAPNPIVSARHQGSNRAYVWKPGGDHVVRSTKKKG